MSQQDELVENVLDAEIACIGIVLHDGTAVDEMPLSGGDFRDPRYGALWDLLKSMAARGEPTAPAAVLPRLSALEVRIEPTVLLDAFGQAPLRATAGHYARIVADAGARRRLYSLGTRMQQMAEGGVGADRIIEEVRSAIDRHTPSGAYGRMVGESIVDMVAALEEPTRAMSTPWNDLNTCLTGWRPGAFYVVGARPGVGKSILGLQAAMGLSQHGYVALSSLEMTEREVLARIIAQRAHVPLGRLFGRSEHHARLTESDHEAIGRAMVDFDRMRISIDDRSGISVADVRQHARQLRKRGPLSGIVVDYLQLMAPAPGDRRPRHEVVAAYSRELKILAREMDCPVIALSQLNREGVRADREPSLADLRESGAIEQDADVVLLMHTPDPLSDMLDLIVAKNRHGVQARVLMLREGAFARLIPRPRGMSTNV